MIREGEAVQILPVEETDIGTPALPSGISTEQALELYRAMVLLRTFDERCLVYHRHGRIGTYPLSWGHEAVQAGGALALRSDDWIFPSYRESAVGILRTLPASTVLAYWRGHPDGFWDPAECRVAPISIPVGSHVPHAVGAAWGERLRGRDTVALAFFGDGATSEGDFHEGANFAGVFRVPVVLLCNNNQWAISTPIEKQTRAKALVDKAVGYGIHGVRVDGNDVLAVYLAVRDAAARGRKGEGPTLVECVSYRPREHATADDPSVYRDDERAAHWRERNCVGRFERYLLRTQLITPDFAERTRAGARALLTEAISTAEAMAPAERSVLFDHVFSELPVSLRRELDLNGDRR